MATTKGDYDVPSVPALVPQAAPPPLPLSEEPLPYNGLAYGACINVNTIPDNELIANVFCFVFSLCNTSEKELVTSYFIPFHMIVRALVARLQICPDGADVAGTAKILLLGGKLFQIHVLVSSD